MSKNRTSFYAIIFLGLLAAAIFVVARIDRHDESQLFNYGEFNTSSVILPPILASFTPTFLPTPTSQLTFSPTPTPVTKIILEVPYISEAPSGNFSGPWKNGCEEASITMVEKYYLGEKSVSIKEAEDFMMMLFAKEDILYGFNKNIDAAKTVKIINQYSSYHGVVKTNPTIEEIKNELRQNRPVISLHRGFDLQNENIEFAPTLSSYHMIVIIGYDDETQDFITNDPGDLKEGAGRRYGYDLLMASLHDYDYTTGKAEGPPTIILTSRF